MATVRKAICRDHAGGRFTPPVRRGRPPVRCTPEYPCSAVETAIPPQGKAKSAHGKQLQEAAVEPVKITRPTRKEMAAERAAFEATDREQRRQAKAVNQGMSDGLSVSLEKAKRAKAELISRGFTVEGHAKGTTAEITAARDDELIVMAWEDGLLTVSQYSLWSTDKPSENEVPASNLPFDVDEISDRELVQQLIGRKVTWFNRLKQGTETAYAGRETLRIDHVYNGVGDETPADRIIHFIDPDHGGFRTFRLGALLKVGK